MKTPSVIVGCTDALLLQTLMAATPPRPFTLYTASTADELLHQAAVYQPAVVVIGTGLPGSTAEALCGRLKQQSSPSLLVLTAHLRTWHLESLIMSGADNCLLQATPTAEVLDCIDAGLSGGALLCKRVSEVTQTLAVGRSLHHKLTEQMVQIIRLSYAGLTAREIGKELCAAPSIIKRRFTTIYENLPPKNLKDLHRFAEVNGIVERREEAEWEWRG